VKWHISKLVLNCGRLQYVICESALACQSAVVSELSENNAAELSPTHHHARSRLLFPHLLYKWLCIYTRFGCSQQTACWKIQHSNYITIQYTLATGLKMETIHQKVQKPTELDRRESLYYCPLLQRAEDLTKHYECLPGGFLVANVLR
jgi:hypothetical protein